MNLSRALREFYVLATHDFTFITNDNHRSHLHYVSKLAVTIRRVRPTKDVKFRFRISAQPGLPKTQSSASALPFCLDCQRSEVPLPHFHSALTAKDFKFCFRTSTQHWQPKIWNTASALPLCIDCQRSVYPLPHFRCQRSEVSLPHYRLTCEDVEFRFLTSAVRSYYVYIST